MIVIAFLLISALYFADIFLRASLKTFWYDELFTVYLCRLPSFHATWAAVIAGTDLNPPLFYLLLHFWMLMVGNSEAATHWLSEIFAVLQESVCVQLASSGGSPFEVY